MQGTGLVHSRLARTLTRHPVVHGQHCRIKTHKVNRAMNMYTCFSFSLMPSRTHTRTHARSLALTLACSHSLPRSLAPSPSPRLASPRLTSPRLTSPRLTSPRLASPRHPSAPSPALSFSLRPLSRLAFFLCGFWFSLLCFLGLFVFGRRVQFRSLEV